MRRIKRTMRTLLVIALLLGFGATKSPEFLGLLTSQVGSLSGFVQESTAAETIPATEAGSVLPEAGDKVLVPVVRVVDGDTIIVLLDGEETRVRFIGIDTPESVHVDDTKNTSEGDVASDYTKALLRGAEIYLEFDVEMYDIYDRVLAYVYLGDLFVNAHLVEEGYAVPKAFAPNTKYKEYFESLVA